MAPLPTASFQYGYNLTLNGSGTYTIGSQFTYVNGFNLTDADDVDISNPDQKNVFGDKTDDNINDPDTFGDVYYIAKIPDNSGIIVSYYSQSNPGSPGSGDYYLLTDNPNYAQGSSISTTSAAYAVCFVSGTLISTTRGDVPVEELVVGDFVVNAAGRYRPIKWIGHRTMACLGRKDALPVRIAAHAFGEGRPARDLSVSPAHAVCIDVLGEVLIPAGRLINGTTITQIEAETVTYWHVELDSHDVLLAEGLPAESYLDCGNRHFFANAEVIGLHAVPDARPEGPLPFCRPFHEDGPLVDLVRARLQERAQALGWPKAALGETTGAVDRADRRQA